MAAIEDVTPEGILRFSFSEAASAGPAIFLDRDGVINQQITGTYVTQWSEFRLMPDIAGALAEISQLPFPIIVISNQAGVGKGIIDVTELSAMTRQFVSQLAEAGGRIDAVYYCPHTPEHRCGCRKPKPGLLRRAANDWRLDLTRCVLIGDTGNDVAAANAAGCRAILLDGTIALSDIPALLRGVLNERA
jgi:D-glycero-D-manno-heptose 1,7-bisphosphate phosphatase